MADLYLARIRTDLGAARLVVIKEVAPKLARDERFAEMLAGEARLAAELRHAAVVQVEDLGREGDSLFIAMEYVEGLDLRELLRCCARQKVKFPVEFSLLIVTEVLRALVYAHRMGVIHRDVSPSNVLLSFDGEIKLCDFGIARAHALCALPAEEALQGKAGYMSPEHARGEVVDARSDVFSLGILLWELLSGRKMYSVGRAAGLSKEEARDDLLELAQRALVPPVPARGLPEEEALHAIVARALAPRREDRYPTASAMLRELSVYAARVHLMGSPLRLGAWLRDHFGTELVTARRARERAVRALELGPPAVLRPIAPPADAAAATPAEPAAVEAPAEAATVAPAEAMAAAAAGATAAAPADAAPCEPLEPAPSSPWVGAALAPAPARKRAPSTVLLRFALLLALLASCLAAWVLATR
jgi:eukaryotic-like serine/threonine-protein kinase